MLLLLEYRVSILSVLCEYCSGDVIMVSVPSSSSSVGNSADFARVTCLHQGPPSPPPALATLSPFTLHQNLLLNLINLLSLYSSTPHSTPATKPPFILHQNFLLTLCTLTLTSYLLACTREQRCTATFVLLL